MDEQEARALANAALDVCQGLTWDDARRERFHMDVAGWPALSGGGGPQTRPDKARLGELVAEMMLRSSAQPTAKQAVAAAISGDDWEKFRNVLLLANSAARGAAERKTRKRRDV